MLNGLERFLRGAVASAAARVTTSAGAAGISGAASAAGTARETAGSALMRSRSFTPPLSSLLVSVSASGGWARLGSSTGWEDGGEEAETMRKMWKILLRRPGLVAN